ncbi:Zn-ribbon domain-containing OB-fold protein [Chelatococcus reniformis]|uniref:DNA-binding protein n=1 Tax=Chelatococcus reniformis TaxID=1494448 RepID=A0A916TXY7_9HYPH|nr:Zn-ribbon domain-containing OB-fold protein [Chelatococcus reniformis]GGC49349.1 DNA-binding protein [Chelatococcus reniformis]
MSDQQRTIPAPVANVETKPYWDAAREGRLLLKRCIACHQLHFYPRALCPFCYGETAWEEASGNGRIYSFSITRKAAPPYAIAFVTLEEGPTIMSNIVDIPLDEVRIGQRVRVVFKPSEDGQPVPMFAPAG